MQWLTRAGHLPEACHTRWTEYDPNIRAYQKALPRWWQVQALLQACGTADATIDEIKRMWIDIRNEEKPIFYDDEVILGD
jgi:hypothetical protein